jgi:hypothetical protein
MNRKGLVAILDGLLAYTIAFVAIGIIVLLMTDNQQADIKSSYTLNVWAEDLADVIGMSMVSGGNEWQSTGVNDSVIMDALNTSLIAISIENSISIYVDIGGTILEYGDIDTSSEIATAKRFLMDGVDDLEVLTVKVGI